MPAFVQDHDLKESHRRLLLITGRGWNHYEHLCAVLRLQFEFAFINEDAERDLNDLYGYIARHDSPKSADRVLDRLLEATQEARFPERGSQPKELRAIGMQEYRQAFFKPYRVIYRVLEDQVVVYFIADGRRDMQSLLSRRLLGG